jgi:hypothetical protein
MRMPVCTAPPADGCAVTDEQIMAKKSITNLLHLRQRRLPDAALLEIRGGSCDDLLDDFGVDIALSMRSCQPSCPRKLTCLRGHEQSQWREHTTNVFVILSKQVC